MAVPSLTTLHQNAAGRPLLRNIHLLGNHGDFLRSGFKTKCPLAPCCPGRTEYDLTGVNSCPDSGLHHDSVYCGSHSIFTALQALQSPLPASSVPHICFAVRALSVLLTCHQRKRGLAEPSLDSPPVTTYSCNRILRHRKPKSLFPSPSGGRHSLPLSMALGDSPNPLLKLNLGTSLHG